MSDASAFRRAGRMGSIQVSEIVQLSELAASMRREGRDVIGLGTGEPDFDTPEHVVEAAHQAMLSGDTKYPVTSGSLDLKAAVRERYRRDHDLAHEDERRTGIDRSGLHEVRSEQPDETVVRLGHPDRRGVGARP